MPKHTVVFEEIVTYEAEIEIPEGQDPQWEDGDGLWFEEVNNQHERWPITAMLEVNERTVLKVDGKDWP